MRPDLYLRAVLTIIAAALLYLCAVLTPLPAANAQTAPRPGDDTGPARVVVVGWNPDVRAGVQVLDSITLKTTGDVRVDGTVQTQPAPGSVSRVVVAGWEERATQERAGQVTPGSFRPLDVRAGNPVRGLPVTSYMP